MKGMVIYLSKSFPCMSEFLIIIGYNLKTLIIYHCQPTIIYPQLHISSNEKKSQRNATSKIILLSIVYLLSIRFQKKCVVSEFLRITAFRKKRKMKHKNILKTVFLRSMKSSNLHFSSHLH